MVHIPKSYFFYRSLSVLLDEVWLIALPLYLAKVSSATSLGAVMSIASTGDLVGMIVLPWLASHLRSSTLAILADLFLECDCDDFGWFRASGVGSSPVTSHRNSLPRFFAWNRCFAISNSVSDIEAAEQHR